MIRLIACDIDGTLLQGAQRDIRPAVFRQIRRLRQAGVLFCPASGRQYSSLRRLFAPVADQLSYLCENGAVVYGPGSPGPVLGKAPMERGLALELCRAILSEPDCEVLISGADTSYLCPKKPDIISHMRDSVGNNVAVLLRPEDVPEDILKVSAFCRQGAEAVQPRLAPRWGTRCNAAIAGSEWLDFNQADKGAGLRCLCTALGIGAGQVMAFGDNYNDLPMLELAGFPYLMDTAASGLRSRFPNHCRRVEDVLRLLVPQQGAKGAFYPEPPLKSPKEVP